ncbi:hypothetical protein OUZ56_004310 [Daphnia magna]|uniref:Uncharacterized protein n=1 Tax=Daphnia magna TaxID=35525 RepID=A0ABQ9YPJ9_9CRUS|nr:hypothetical protein OUZ56_004310 [Daphnia magna]
MMMRILTQSENRGHKRVRHLSSIPITVATHWGVVPPSTAVTFIDDLRFTNFPSFDVIDVRNRAKLKSRERALELQNPRRQCMGISRGLVNNVTRWKLWRPTCRSSHAKERENKTNKIQNLLCKNK